MAIDRQQDGQRTVVSQSLGKQPAEGLTPEAALKRWSDPVAYAGMIEFSDSANRHTNQPESLKRYREYHARRGALEDAFISKLKSGEVLASAIMEGSDYRSVIRPSLWRVLDIAYDFDEVGGNGPKYVAVEFFERKGAIPQNVDHVPDWLLREQHSQCDERAFVHDESYAHVSLEGELFTLGPLQAKVVRDLHEAWRSGTSQWLHGKELLGAVGASSTRLGDLFKSKKNWRHLIESDSQGRYRLRLAKVSAPSHG
jgi:hypothetical protein